MTPHTLLTQAGFQPGEQHQLLAFCQEREMSVEQLLRYSVCHYFDACDYGNEKVPPANFDGEAPSFCPPESVFVEEKQ